MLTTMATLLTLGTDAATITERDATKSCYGSSARAARHSAGETEQWLDAS